MRGIKKLCEPLCILCEPLCHKYNIAQKKKKNPCFALIINYNLKVNSSVKFFA
jgi:hypothetical protein